MTPINNHTIAPYLFEKKLVFDAIGKKQLKIMQNDNEKKNHAFFKKKILSDENAKERTII